MCKLGGNAVISTDIDFNEIEYKYVDGVWQNSN
jgi:hypothetical protein